MKVTLYIENRNESRTAEVEDELTIGRTPSARLVLNDEGLSRVNTTIFVEGDEVLVADENSTNGTFLNGEKIVGRPRLLRDGDRLTLGTHTTIRVAIGDKPAATTARAESIESVAATTPERSPAAQPAGQRSQPPYVLIAAAAMTVLILGLGGLAIFLLDDDGVGESGTSRSTSRKSKIPERVMDPVGSENEDSLEDLISSWETEEAPLDAKELKEISSSSSSDPTRPSDLNVPIEFWRQQLSRALNHGAGGPEPGGLIPLPIELTGRSVVKQRAKLREMIQGSGYMLPMDFADLAKLRLEGNFLTELPMATESYVLDIGGSATGEDFTSFEFAGDGSQVRRNIDPSHPKYKFLKQLADNFDGQRYDLQNPADRKQMRIRLLRMYNKNSRRSFEELTKAFYQQFKVPLRVTSLTRSIDYQISLNRTNANSYKVSGMNSLPPHTSGCAFDISRKNLTAAEQNFLMTRLAEMERSRSIDSLREGSANACFHSFIYPDGMEPRSLSTQIASNISKVEVGSTFPFLGFFEGF